MPSQSPDSLPEVLGNIEQEIQNGHDIWLVLKTFATQGTPIEVAARPPLKTICSETQAG